MRQPQLQYWAREATKAEQQHAQASRRYWVFCLACLMAAGALLVPRPSGAGVFVVVFALLHIGYGFFIAAAYHVSKTAQYSRWARYAAKCLRERK